MKHRLSSALVVLALSLTLFVTPTLAATLVVDGGDGACSDVTGAPYCTIQAAIDAAAPGDTITVAAYTYDEQLFITKSLILDGGGVATIAAPAVLVADAGGVMLNIVTVDGAGVEAEISGFTITGPGPSGCGSINSGLMVRGGADLNLHDNTISDIRDEPFSGCQNGQGIWVGRTAMTTTGTATITNNVFSGYQKGGIVVDNVGSSAVITGNTVTGAGPTATIAHNGIQVSRGATATVTGNTVSGHNYTGVEGAVGIMLYQAGSPTIIGPNTSVTTNELGIWTDLESTLADIDLSGVTGNVRDAVADFTGWSTPTAWFVDDDFSANISDADGGDIVDFPGASLHVFGFDAFATIQVAIDAASAGDTVNVAAGTYSEALAVNEEVSIVGAGDGEDDSVDTIITLPAPGTIVQISASNVTLSDLRVDHNEDPLVGNSANIAFGASVTNITFNRITSTEARNGLLVSSGITVDGLTIDGSHFDGNREAWYLAKETAASNPHTVRNVLVTNTTFNDNTNKGIYAEKLEDAVFDNIEVTNSGTNPAYGFNNGIDINLKWAAYQNITIQNSTVTDSGLLGTAGNQLFAVGITIKARDQGGYTGTPASLDGVTIDNVTVTGGQNGIRFGEPQGANPLQAAITNLQIIDSSFYDNVVFGLSNETAGIINAEGTWWGDASGPYDDSTVLPDACALALENPAGLGDQVSGCVLYDPWFGQALGQPTLLSPANNALLTDYTPTFDWTDVPGAAYYQIEINPNMPTATAVGNVTNSEWTPANDLPKASRFFWRVRAFNSLNIAGSWSATWSFRTAVLAPILQRPTDGDTLTDRTPTFMWKAVSGAQNYKLEVSRNLSFAHLVVSETVAGLTYTLPDNLAPNKTYYWRVRTNSTQFGPSEWSQVRTFKEAGLALPAPTLQKPNNGGKITDQTPAFNWQDVAGAEGYMIQISRLANFSKLVKVETVTKSQYVMENTMQKNVTFYWRVRAVGPESFGEWSATWSFSIK